MPSDKEKEDKKIYVVLGNKKYNKSQVVLVTPYPLYADMAKTAIFNREDKFIGATIVEVELNIMGVQWDTKEYLIKKKKRLNNGKW